MKRIVLFPELYPTGGHYPFNLRIFHETRNIEFHSPVSFFVGENGSGKSTLLKAIAHRSNIHIWRNNEGRRLSHNPFEEYLYRFIDTEWTDGVVEGAFFASDLFQDFARMLEEWAAASPEVLEYFGGRSLITQSHGQSLMSYFRTRFRKKGLFLLDEPETALSPKRQIELLNILKNTGKSGHAQFIIATQSPILITCPGAEIYSFDFVPVRQLDYRKTDLYRIYKKILND